MKVLIVDDSEQFREAARLACTELDSIDVILSKDGYEALPAIKRHRPDLILTDIDMPDLNGIKLTEIATSLDYQVVVMTGNESPLDKALAGYGGAIGYIVKNEDFSNEIKRIVKAHSNG